MAALRVASFISLAVFLACAGYTHAVSCYTSTGTDPSCVACSKTVVSIPLGGSVVTKACEKTSCTPVSAGGFGVGGYVYCCSNVNLCNSAWSVRATGPLLALLSVATVTLFRRT